ncbi:MAG: metallophosphatase family protein [Prevotellaceae bacterium]|jgi:putative phosphoesterase|nr:metallophosphatase family protein [Prevotellaceae bacterium]
MKIGIISDTHGFFDEKLRHFLNNVDEIWHAGDIGSLKTADEIASFKPLYAVHGNIDDAETRVVYPKILEFHRENFSIAISHIVGYPGKYSEDARQLLKKAPKILIGGHSHILKIIYDKKNSLLFMNPGAAGINGIHKVRTALRFSLINDDIKDMEVGEWNR